MLPPQSGPQASHDILQEWVANHRMFVATLEELAGQLAALQPPSKERAAASQQQPSALLQRLLDRAPSEQLAAYASGTLPAKDHLQRSLPEALDANLRLLGVLAAEMRRFVGQVEAAADAAAAAALAGGVDDGSGSSSSAERGAETALLMAGALVGVSRETELVERATAAFTLTTPPEEVSAAAMVLALRPFVDDTLLSAALADKGMQAQQRGT
ncbi:Major antigen [Micractinium conductrix]|uniref:Major antigen n=1 Tax=Micractinium conductrix TaxID=554055 RepID=A0A2P6VBA7_9CHLO|nr:Major antigen [Micractinium conductrix]|eukprot:PSC71375.1 Major antigen [Micractinium conductrix]